MVKEENKVIGAFLITYKNIKYWKDRKEAIYLHQFVTKIGYPGIGNIILNFLENLAFEKNLDTIRLDCVKDNIKLNNYYKKRGFKNQGEAEIPYSHRLWEKNLINRKILEFYKRTSPYTDLGLYNDFAKNLPDDIGELCLLQRNQIIHPFDLSDEQMRKDKNSCYGDMTKIPITKLRFENDLFPTAQAILAELLRRDKNYSLNRKIEDKIHVCCREQAILLASILKSKGFSARVRSGFAKYVNTSGKTAGDHWITEYYDIEKENWTLVDADMYFYKDVLDEYHIDFSLLDIPYDKFIFGAEAYLGLRTGKLKDEEIYFASLPPTLGINASIHGLFYDFHSLMNNEIIFLHLPKYIIDKKFKLSEEEYKELDELAKLMLDPNKNFNKLLNIWNNNLKYRIMSGALNL